MRVAYFDCLAGISGLMALGALLDAGADLDPIATTLGSLPGAGVVLEQEHVVEHGIPAVRVHVKVLAEDVIWTYSSIRSILEAADLPSDARQTAVRAFARLAEAEARVQGRDVELATFHASGEPDALVPILGAALALHQLEVDRVFASPVPTGLGMSRTEHGAIPIPSPVVLDLLTGVPMYSRGISAELVTPIGAAILSSVAEGYGDIPLMRTERVGYGAGELRLDVVPNVLRVLIGEAEPAAPIGPPGEDLLLQVRMSELGPQEIPGLLGELLAAGASDAWITPIVGADGEPAVLVSAVTDRPVRAAVRRLLQGRAGAAEIRALPVRPPS